MDKLPILYQKIADLTASSCHNGVAECSKFLDRKYRCCERQYCELTRKFAKEKYDIDLLETGNPDLPFMGEEGCTIAPHLRPICAIHVCSYTWSACPSSPKGYQQLRDEILTEAKAQNKEPMPCL